MKDLIETANDTKKGADLTQESADILNNAGEALETNAANELGETLSRFEKELPVLQNLTNEAFVHAMDLRDRVRILFSYYNIVFNFYLTILKSYLYPGRQTARAGRARK